MSSRGDDCDLVVMSTLQPFRAWFYTCVAMHETVAYAGASPGVVSWHARNLPAP